MDPVNVFVKQRLGHWGEAVLLLGARRAEGATRAQTMSNRETRSTGILPVADHGQDGRATKDRSRGFPLRLSRHPDLPRVWVSNPIEFLTTEDVWAYLLQNPNPWGRRLRFSERRQPPFVQTLRQRLERRVSHPD